MITYTVSDKPLLTHSADAYVLCLPEDFSFQKDVKPLVNGYIFDLEKLIKRYEFTGQKQSSFFVHMSKDNETKGLILLGLGKKGPKAIEHYRRALGNLIRVAEQHQCLDLAFEVPSASFFGITPEQLGQETAVILAMAQYHFDEFFKDKKQKRFNITLQVNSSDMAAFKIGVDTGAIIGKAVNKARYYIDMPAEHMAPDDLVKKAREVAQERGLKCTVFNEAEIIKMGMGGLAGVSKGSDRDCHLVVLEYKSNVKNAPTLAFVGKGITFDSGGLSLKPAQYMETMKEDMSGAAAVLEAIDALAQLNPPVNIISVMPISENLPSGKATKPGDIITFYNGKTAEVRNTDAEGRLILADALSYTEQHYKPDAIIDVATLTGACAYAFGPFFTGMMSQYPELQDKVQKSGDRTGDRVWALPFDDDYKVAVKSKIADICNIGSPVYKAGAITAGFFLQHFVEKTPWVHLDIAGTAFDVPDISYYRPGATGSAVRLLIDLARNWE